MSDLSDRPHFLRPKGSTTWHVAERFGQDAPLVCGQPRPAAYVETPVFRLGWRHCPGCFPAVERGWEPTPEALVILCMVDRSEAGYCRVDGNVHPDGYYTARSVAITHDRLVELEDLGLMRRRHVSGWRSHDQWVPTDAGHAMARSRTPSMSAPVVDADEVAVGADDAAPPLTEEE
jgi:hypothetical protein